MSAQQKAILRTVRRQPLSVRREQHNNVVQWREQAVEARIRTLPLPAATSEDDDAEMVRPWVQNVALGLVAGAAIVLAIASGAGAL